MTDLTDPSGASLRLSNDERERAVSAIQAHAAQGRLSEAEVQSRVQSARAAVTRGDLAPLFADLPGGVDLDGPGAGAGAGAGGGAGAAYAAPAAAAQPARDPYATPSEPYSRPANRRWGLAIVSVAPFVALILFFVTSTVWGYAYSWLWFLLVPITGAIVYGADGGRDRDRR
ncbi:hypothetical protein ASE16_09155 [Leifsonia sp. Root227]|uniref:DUF1707 SHOCT-like domain-containing protein n=1 Tax=Leifsonia sp. Root227 TaxID=1736496 RepID=UPI0006FAFF09|nr:DUF1707 domain-containing protein [Leifsonia sp. Root227]KRC51087.1 hypothetical protein ASE16_09155 [Leifsonia sp. Root227]